jgi:chromosome transmission fidelity protein 18
MRRRPLDTLNAFYLDKASQASGSGPTRYAVRQVLQQELRKEQMLQSSQARQNRTTALSGQADEEHESNKENQEPDKKVKAKNRDVKRDFFGRVIEEQCPPSAGKETKKQSTEKAKEADRVWVSFHEGFSNAVRKPITLRELMDGF